MNDLSQNLLYLQLLSRYPFIHCFVFQVGQESNASSLTCLCNHLTAFGGEVLVAPNTIDFVLVQQSFDNLDPGDLLVLITVCSAFLAYLVVLIIARRADNLDVLKVCINNLYKDMASSPLDNV